MLQSKAKFSVDELKRLYYDMVGLADMSIEEVHKVREEAKYINANADTYYYMERTELIEDYYTRVAKFQKHMMSKGLA